MKNILTFMGTLTIATSSMVPLTITNNIKSNEIAEIAVPLRYSWNESYYQKDNDKMNYNQQILNWKQYKNDFSSFANEYRYISIIGFLTANIKGESGYVAYSLNAETKELDRSEEIFSAPYFETAGRYTIVNLKVLKLGDYLCFNWEAFFKGNVTNIIEIEIYSIMFSNIAY